MTEVENLDINGLTLTKPHQSVYPKKKRYVELPTPDCLENMIEGLQILFENDEVNIEEVKKYMAEYKSNPADWRKYAKFDAHRYFTYYFIV